MDFQKLVFIILIAALYATADDLPKDDFQGPDETSVVCAIQKPGQATKYEYLIAAKGIFVDTYTKIKGKWVHHYCGYGHVQPFHTSTETYQKVLKLCKDKGYETAQPSYSSFGGWYPFQVGEYLTEHLYKPFTVSPLVQAVKFPLLKIPDCPKAFNGQIPDDVFIGTTTAKVACVKSGGKWDYLYTSKGILFDEYKEITGSWDSHTCAFGEGNAFRVSTKDYNDVLKKCKDAGFETAQAYYTGLLWYPFQIGEKLLIEHYEPDHEKYPTMEAPPCTVTSNFGNILAVNGTANGTANGTVNGTANASANGTANATANTTTGHIIVFTPPPTPFIPPAGGK